MTRETYDHWMELLPITAPGGFWLSCLHEATLHPQLLDFIEATPKLYRDRLSINTNLSARLSSAYLERLANSGIYQLRVSLDSQELGAFAVLRKKAKYEVFDDNLRRLSLALKNSRWRPHLRFITTVFRDNKQEVADLVRSGRELGGESHEVRYPYYVPSLAQWGKSHILSEAEWSEVERDLEAFPSDYLQVCGPALTGPTLTACEEEHGLESYVARPNAFGDDDDALNLTAPEPETIGGRLPNEALELRLRWDGLIGPCKLPAEEFRVNIKTLPASKDYFRRLRAVAGQKFGAECEGVGAPMEAQVAGAGG